jgi:putative ABC transport system permease protein
MLKNYFRTAVRFILKNKIFSFINIIGLAAGTLCCLYILLYVMDQYSYDKHYTDAQLIYRINSDWKYGGVNHRMATTSPPIAPAMKKDFSEVAQFTRVVPTTSLGAREHLLRYQDKSFYEKDGLYADPDFFRVFTYHFVAGNGAGVLSDPYTVVLLQSAAGKLFGNENPVGKVIEIDNAYGKHNFTVTGVVDESLGKSHIPGNLFMSMNSGGLGDFVSHSTDFAGSLFVASYLKLSPAANAAALEKKLPAFLNQYAREQLSARAMEKQMSLQPVTTIHTTTGYESELSKPVSPALLYILLLIAALIQIIACINFMNLSTAHASKRAKEVGVRKVMGAGRRDLVRQFVGESFVLALTGVLLAIPLLLLLLPYLNHMAYTTVGVSMLLDYKVWLMLVGLVLVTGLVAGSYPAFYLSAFEPIKVIKGNFTSQISAAGLRKSLVVFQFILSILLISGIIIIYRQMSFIRNKDLGFDKNQQLIFTFHTNDARQNVPAFMNDLRQFPEIAAVSRANNYLGQFVYNDRGVYLDGGNETTAHDAEFIFADEYFRSANGIRLTSGKDFRLQDTGKVLINETLALQLGLKPATAPGTRLYFAMGGAVKTWQIAGVMKDFNYKSLHEEVKPFMLIYTADPEELSNVIVNTNSRNYGDFLDKMKTVWRKDLPGVPFEFAFLSEEIQKQYELEVTLSHIVNCFALMTVLISCMGLFGLAAFSAEQRNKEIGVRKVLGASVTSIIVLLSKDFLKLVLVAIVIATPISWWAMDRWLQGFAYRIPISWWMFALAGLLAISIALFTVSFQAIKAAFVNPVKSLKTV